MAINNNIDAIRGSGASSGANVPELPLPCAVLFCFLRLHSILMCKLEACCYRWMREATEDRQREKERERLEKEGAA
jgi:hypothetical protein